MKNMKKLASLLLVLVMVFALAAPALAAGDGSITISDAEVGQTYTLYKIFDLAYAGTNEPQSNAAHTYSIDSSSDWYDFVKEGGDGAAYVTLTRETGSDTLYYVTWKAATDADTVQAFAKLALEYANKTVAITGTEEKATSSTVIFENLDLGYYLIDSSLGALCTLDSANRNATVNEKNDKPTIEKKEDTVTGNEPGVGDSVNYTVTVHAKKGAQSYVVHDTMSTGLSFNGTVTVTVGETNLTADTDYVLDTAPDDNHTFDLTINKSYLDTITGDTDIVIKYSATITEEAVEKVDNKAKLTYGDNNETNETPSQEVPHNLYAFNLVKTNSDEMGKEVLNAKFELYTTATDGAPVELIYVADGDYYRPTVEGEEGITEFDAGIVTIKGLGNGDYYLEETVQPDGYNKLNAREKVEIVLENSLTEVSTYENEGKTIYEEGAFRVVNLTGAELPSTGGIGTTLFYIVGGLLIVGAAVLLITKKRVSGEQ